MHERWTKGSVVLAVRALCRARQYNPNRSLFRAQRKQQPPWKKSRCAFSKCICSLFTEGKHDMLIEFPMFD